MRGLDLRRALERVRPRVDGVIRHGDTARALRLIAFGKAAVPMTRWFLDAYRPQLADGVLSAPECPREPWVGVRCFSGGHPVPNEESLLAGAEALRVAGDAGEHDLVVFLISGGGSALLESPIEAALGLEDMRSLNATLVSCGADIVDINVVRKHLSAVKGGRLALAAFPARQLTLYISDVPDGQDASVASGPTMPDASTLEDFRRVVSTYRLQDEMPPGVSSLDNPALPETPKPGDPCFERSEWICVLDNRHAIEAAGRFAEARGWHAVVDTSVDDEDVSVAAGHLLGRLRALQAQAGAKSVCVISGGELSSPVRGVGVGGRNQAFVLECVERIAGEPIAVLSAGTDGIDGNSPAAGAVADGSTLERARALRMDPSDYRARSDSHTFFERLGDDVTCGATQNNVRDIRVLIMWPLDGSP